MFSNFGHPRPQDMAQPNMVQPAQIVQNPKAVAPAPQNADPDGSLIDLDFEKNLTKIDYDKMKREMDIRHARRPNGTPYDCADVCYGFEPGSHYCIKSSAKSELTKFGVGIMLYFKFLKHLIFFFSVFTFLSLPALVIYSASFVEYNKNSDSISYIDLLTATTVGAVGLGSDSCGVTKYSAVGASTGQMRLTFQCPTGAIGDVSTVVYGLAKTGTTCRFLDEGEINANCNAADSTATLTTMLSTCKGMSSPCTVTVDKNIFKTGDSTCDALYNSQNIYMKVSCSTTSLQIFGKYTISKSTVALSVGILDAIVIIVFLLMIYSLKFAQRNATQNVLKTAYSASSYTLEVKNLPQTMPAEELAAKLWTFIDSKLGANAIQSGHRVVDVQIVLPNRLIECNKKVGEIVTKKNSLIRQLMQLYVPDYPKNQVTFKELHQIVSSMKEKKFPRLKEVEKLYKKIKELVIKKERIQHEIEQLKTTKDVRMVSSFITFSSIPARNKINDLLISSPISRFFRMCCSCCYEKDTSFCGNFLIAKSASDPGSILWENLGEPGFNIFLRRTFSTILTVLLWVISGGVLLVSTYYKNIFKQSYPTIDCSSFNEFVPSITQVSNDYNLGDRQTGLLECYCGYDIFNRINTVFPASNGSLLCTEWFKNKLIENGVTFAIVFAVLVVNYAVQFVFQGLSKFEKHSTLNKQLATRVIKTFVAQFLNTGLLILVINAKLPISFWQGQFRDISPLWYQNVGSTLLSTMVINIITVPLVNVMGIWFQKLKRCCDRGCSSDERSTKKLTQASYENVYTGPEFIIDFRYSQMLTLTFVCFLYSGGMPFLYVTTLLQFIITYFFDKLYLLRVSRLPKNYDENLEATVRITLYCIIVFHLVFSIFMFGNPQIFDESGTIFSAFTSAVSSITDKINQGNDGIHMKFMKRSLLQQNVVLFILLLLVLTIFIVNGLLLGFLKKTVFAVFAKDNDQTRNKAANTPKVAPTTLPNYTLFHVIKSEDIASLIRLTKVTIKSTKNEELIQHYKRKLVLLKQEYLIKRHEEENGKVDPNINFIGFYTYDVRLHPTYKAQFAIEEMLDDENLN